MVQDIIFKAGIAAIALALAVPAAAQSSRSYDLSGFDGISVTGAYALQVEVGSGYSITVSGPEDRLADARVRVENGDLVLAERECRNCHREGGLIARITLPSLDSLEVTGIADDSRITGIDAGDFSIDVSGVAELALSGRCGRLSLTVEGVSEIDGRNLRCGDAVADLDGVGEASIYASNSLDADVDGMARLTVHGSPQSVQERSSGFARVDVR
ncbi:MAG: GIN domain-containing protein [Parasphingopyxis sp.]|nr:DUF2807 domain-containing protein [Sphingomonadales bacterium]